MKRILTILGIAAAIAGGFAIPAGASVASPHASAARYTPSVAAFTASLAAHNPRGLPPSIWNIWAQNGGQMCVGVGSGGDAAGQPVIEKSNHANCSTMTDTFFGFDANDEPEYYWTFESGNYLAATSDCTKATIKSSALSNGVVWTLHPDGGNFEFYPRYCNTNANPYVHGLSGDDTAGNQWLVRTGGYQSLVVHNLE